MTSPEEVAQFLENFRSKLGIWGLLFMHRSKNTNTLLELEFTVQKVKELLRELEVNDFCEGPVTDEILHFTELWVFGKTIKEKEIYIKIALGKFNSQNLCVSFHFAEYPMTFPFKANKVEGNK